LRGLSLALATLAQGCSVNDVGLIRVRHLESDSARVVRLEAWGLHLLTRTEDAGVTLGHSDRTYVFAREGYHGASFSLSALAADSKTRRLRPAPCEPCPALGSLGRSLAQFTRTTGMRFDANAARVGFALGSQTRAALRLRLDQPLILLMRSNPEDLEAGEVYIAPEVK
jgi:hypothetical protein